MWTWSPRRNKFPAPRTLVELKTAEEVHRVSRDPRRSYGFAAWECRQSTATTILRRFLATSSPADFDFSFLLLGLRSCRDVVNRRGNRRRSQFLLSNGQSNLRLFFGSDGIFVIPHVAAASCREGASINFHEDSASSLHASRSLEM